MSRLQIDKVDFSGWRNSFRLSNGEIELILTSDIGPRVMRFGFVRGQNFFKEFRDQLGKSGESQWQPRGGHRLWAAPEDRIRSYALDNGPIDVRVEDGALIATQPVEPETGLEKQITVKMAETGGSVEVVHRIRNAGGNPCELAAWALTMMTPGGVAIHGLPPRGRHPEMLDASGPLVLWTYTDLSDPRWRLGRKYIVLRQDPQNSEAQKIGSFNPYTWGAYALNCELFIKRCEAKGNVPEYPDFGCSFETFTNADFLELETLGPVRKLVPGESVTHIERWSAHRDISFSSFEDAELDRLVLPLLA